MVAFATWWGKRVGVPRTTVAEAVERGWLGDGGDLSLSVACRGRTRHSAVYSRPPKRRSRGTSGGARHDARQLTHAVGARGGRN